jgi:ribonuclease-3
MNKFAIEELEEKLGYKFNNKALLKNAITHKTFAFEASIPIEYNERLEFLGDSILNFVVAEQLYNSNKYFSEGELTRRRALSVNNKILARKAMELEIGRFILFGKGEKKQNGATNRKNLANTFEALIGAIYLDSNMKSVRKIILDKIFDKEFEF